jgi:hypothetical protein
MKTNLTKKGEAINLRLRGESIRDIEKAINVSRSTLSGWLHNIKLSKAQKKHLHKKWLDALVKARLKANRINRDRHNKKIEKIKQEAKDFTSDIIINKKIGKLIFATFYLAEGTKTDGAFVIANSNPNILTAFLNLFRYLYSPEKSKFRCCLHLRKDQHENILKKYWSNILNIPKSQFLKTQFDKRTIKPTFKNYKGVCVVFYYNSDLQRRIVYLGKELLQLINVLGA